jgi:hypothetical protein
MRRRSISLGWPVSLLIAGAILFEPNSSSCAAKEKRPGIMNFSPTTFGAKSSSPFFYAIGEEVKYSNSIDPNSPTIFRGKIWNFQVSPDGKRMAFVSDHRLMVVDQLGKAEVIGSVDSVERNFKPVGKSFIRDNEFQWSPDSKALYFIRDTFYRSKMMQLFSDLGELWRFDIESAQQQLVIKPFRAFQIILAGESDIYFAVPLANGDLKLELFDGNIVRDIASGGSGLDSAGKLPIGGKKLVYSFSAVEYMQKVLPGMHVTQDFDFKQNTQTLKLGDKARLEMTRYCDSFFGCGDCDEMVGSVFLPGDRFFLLNVPYCSNYKGELLIDLQTGSYMPLPKDTRVFVTANTETYPHYRFDNEGISIE